MSVIPELNKRLFLALWPDQSFRAGLAEMEGFLRRNISGQWIKPDNLHLTLLFIGETSPERLPLVRELAASCTTPPFTLPLERVECWTNGIVCLSSKAMPEALGTLATALSRKFGHAGFEVDRRPFRAHLTLARKGRAAHKLALLPDTLVWKVHEFCLVESLLTPSGAVYSVRECWPLIDPILPGEDAWRELLASNHPEGTVSQSVY